MVNDDGWLPDSDYLIVITMVDSLMVNLYGDSWWFIPDGLYNGSFKEKVNLVVREYLIEEIKLFDSEWLITWCWLLIVIPDDWFHDVNYWWWLHDSWFLIVITDGWLPVFLMVLFHDGFIPMMILVCFP